MALSSRASCLHTRATVAVSRLTRPLRKKTINDNNNCGPHSSAKRPRESCAVISQLTVHIRILDMQISDSEETACKNGLRPREKPVLKVTGNWLN